MMPTLGVDTWEELFRRLPEGDESQWQVVAATRDAARMDRVIALAETILPLEQIGSGPAREPGLGPQWRPHRILDVVLQELPRFPGRAWFLIRAGIRSPVVRNRHLALRALSVWGPEAWPVDARVALVAALHDEPDAEVRIELESVLAGHRIAPASPGLLRRFALPIAGMFRRRL
jgi:hypothetical protein